MICKRSYRLTPEDRREIKIALINKPITMIDMCKAHKVRHSQFAGWFYGGDASRNGMLNRFLNMLKAELGIDLMLRVDHD